MIIIFVSMKRISIVFFIIFLLISSCFGINCRSNGFLDSFDGISEETDYIFKDSLINAVLQSISTDTVQQIIIDMENFKTRFALAENRRDIAVWLKNRFINAGYDNVVLDSFYVEIERHTVVLKTWQYNVVARLEGKTDTDKKYILGAHYDSINYMNDDFDAPGADDNASGIAAVLEVARVFKQHQISPKYNITFVCFAAEEIDKMGSTYYAEKLSEQNVNVALMINNDMIAYNPDNKKQWKFNVQKYPGTERFIEIIENIAHNYTVLKPVTTTGFLNHSDSYPFHLQGYKAVFFNEYTFNNNIHTFFDIIDNLDIDYCTEIIKISGGLLLEENL